MRHRRISVFICGIILFLLSGCIGNKPSNLIPEKKYINLYVEFQMLRGYKHLYGDTVNSKEIRQKILDKYGVTLKQFRESDDYYEAQPDQNERLRKAMDIINTVKDSVWHMDRGSTETYQNHPMQVPRHQGHAMSIPDSAHRPKNPNNQ